MIGVDQTAIVVAIPVSVALAIVSGVIFYLKRKNDK